jgi:DNA polymerase-3 subunit delta'
VIDLPWLQIYQQQFSDLLLQERAPHALLITGGKGLGKLQLAQNMAQMAICEKVSKAGACQLCPACLLFNAGNHTDFTHISAEKVTIKVEQIRKLSHDIILTSTRNQYKVILIQEAELMNKAAANALLKTLEEPPPKVIIILTSNEVGRLLPTIKSRCMKLSVSPPKYEQVSNWLKLNSQQSDQDRAFSLMLNNASPLMALSMLENNSIITIKEMLADLKSLTSGDKTALEVSKEWIDNEHHHLLTAIAAYFMVSFKSEYNLNFNYENVRIEVNTKYLMNFIKKIYVYNQRVVSVLKPQLLLEELLLNWKNISN